MYALGMTTTKHMVEGVAVHSSGAGPAVVLLHANGGNHHDFDAVVEQVAATHTVHAVDWPGWGDSPVEGDPTALGYAALLPRVLHGLGGGPFVLIGNSVGGFAAIRTAATHPELGGIVNLSEIVRHSPADCNRFTTTFRSPGLPGERGGGPHLGT